MKRQAEDTCDVGVARKRRAIEVKQDLEEDKERCGILFDSVPDELWSVILASCFRKTVCLSYLLCLRQPPPVPHYLKVS
jgi:hypothetical protein